METNVLNVKIVRKKGEMYSYNAYLTTINHIVQLTKEGLGIRSTAWYLNISTTTLLKRIMKIASKIVPSKITEV